MSSTPAQIQKLTIPKSIFNIDMDGMKTFESKTGQFTGWDPKEGKPDETRLLNERQFTVIIYARSQEADASSGNLSDKDKEANKYFCDQIKQTDDPDLFHLMMSDFTEWHKLMETMNFAHIARDKIKSIFKAVYEIVNDYKEKQEQQQSS